MTPPDASEGAVTPPGLFGMLIVAGAFACILMLNPFGIGTASSQRSEQAVLRITAPLYENSDRVAVVLIDDAFIDAGRDHVLSGIDPTVPNVFVAEGYNVIQNPDGTEIDLVEKKLSDVVRHIRGKRGTKVRLIVQPEGTKERKIYELVREKIELK